jgi:hypothetical protein
MPVHRRRRRARVLAGLLAAVLGAGVPVDAGAVATAGTVDELAVDGGSEYSPWAGGVYFRGERDTVTATRLSDSLFEIRATSGADSPMGAREVAFTIGSMAYGARLAAGVTYPLYTGGHGRTPPALFSSAGDPPCAGQPGALTVDTASFTTDGTPLTFAGSFTYCGDVHGHVRWHARTSVSGALLTADRGRLDFGVAPAEGDRAAQTVTFQNAGAEEQALGAAHVDEYAAGAPPNYLLGADTCSGRTLGAGASCSVTVLAGAGARRARLLLDDRTEARRRSVLLAAGPDRPAPTTLTATPTLRAVELTWPRNGADAGPTGYTLYRGVGSAAPTTYAEIAVDGAQGAFTDRNVDLNTTYHYAVTASNDAGESLPALAAAAPVATGVLTATDRWSGTDRRDIAVIAANGVFTRLTADAGDHETPAVSPDSSTIAYTSDVGNAPGDYDLWVAPVGGVARKVTADPATSDGEPAFAPDGRTLAFTRLGASGRSVWTVPVAGGVAVQVPGTAGDGMPAWSPTGRLLAVAHAGARSSIVLTNLAGDYRGTVPDPDAATVDAFDPAFSPDAKRVSYVRADRTSTVVAISAVRGTAPPTPAGPPSFAVRSQQWGPGGRLVFEGYRVAEKGGASTGGTLWQATFGEPVPVPGADAGVAVSPAVAEPPLPRKPAVVEPVAGLSGTVGPGFVSLSWRPPPAGATPDCATCPQWFVVRRSAPGGPAPTTPEAGVPVYEGTGTSVTATGLTDGASYTFAVFAIGPQGDASAPLTLAFQPN